MKPILIADDNQDHRELVTEILEDLCSAEIIQVNNGKELIEMVQKEDYSFIISDFSMGETSGIDAAKILKGNNKETPIFLMSAENRPSFHEMEEKHYITEYIPKENLHDLRNIVGKYVKLD